MAACFNGRGWRRMRDMPFVFPGAKLALSFYRFYRAFRSLVIAHIFADIILSLQCQISAKRAK